MKEYLFKSVSKEFLVSIEPQFSLDRSFPEIGIYVWEYKIVIKNRLDKCVHIKKPNWSIFDLFGRNFILQDDLVQNEKPILKPFEEHEYTHFATMSSPMGVMQGWYDLEDDKGDKIKACVPFVSLDSPFHELVMH